MAGPKAPSSTPVAEKSLLQQIQESDDDAQAMLVKDVSFDELIAQLQGSGELLDATQIGDGYHLLQGKDDKKKLVGVPFVITEWKMNPGRFGGFATLHLKTAQPVFFDGTAYTHFIVNDGSTGIKRQLLDLQADPKVNPRMILCRRGLRVSEDYEVMEDFVDADGETKQRPVIDPSTGKPVLGTTFYLDTSL